MTPEEQKRQLADNLLRELSDRGQIVEGGWRAYVLLTDLENAPALQIKETRQAFFAGAQHLFASVLCMLDPGQDATEQDMHRMTLLNKELEAWTEQMKRL